MTLGEKIKLIKKYGGSYGNRLNLFNRRLCNDVFRISKCFISMSQAQKFVISVINNTYYESVVPYTTIFVF